MGETKARLISGFGIAFIYIFCFSIDHFIFVHYFFFALFGFTFFILTLNEFYNLYLASTNIKPHMKTGFTFGILIYLLFYIKLLKEIQLKGQPLHPLFSDILENFDSPMQWVIFFLLCILFMSFIIQMFQKKVESSIEITGVTLTGVIYTALPIGHVVLIMSFENPIFYILLSAFATIASDAMAYFSGRYFGKHKTGLSVSPNKTYEGYTGGLIGQQIVIHLFYHIAGFFADVPEIHPLNLTFLGVVIFFATGLGDLVESMIKRELKVKDSGKSVSGHGGFLDLADGIIVVGPLFYYFSLILLDVS